MELPPMWMDGLTPEMEKKAERELGETEEVKLKGLENLRNLINGETDFSPRMDDAFLLRFLRVRKFDVEKAFVLLKNYYTFKARYSRILTDFTPSEIEKVLDMNMHTILPKRLPDGCGVGFMRLGFFDTDVATPHDLFAAAFIASEVALQLDATQVCGGAIVFDLSNFGVQLLRYFASPTYLYRVVTFAQSCIPCRAKSFHVVNEPAYFHIISSICKRFLSAKIKSRIHFHGTNLNSLHKHIPPEMLPEELGGNLGPMDNSEFRQRLLSQEDYFKRFNSYGFQAEKAQKIRSSKTYFW